MPHAHPEAPRPRLNASMRNALDQIRGYGRLGVSRRGWHGATINALLRAGVIEEIRTPHPRAPDRANGDWVRVVVPLGPTPAFNSGEVSVLLASLARLRQSGDARMSPTQYDLLVDKLAAHGEAAIRNEVT